MKIEERFKLYVANDYLDAEENALKCAEIANEHARSFAQYIHNNPCVFNNGWSMQMVLDYFNKEYNQ